MKAEDFKDLEMQYNKAMNALYLELPSSIVNDVKLISYEYRKAYARIQIEKDRERICKLLPLGALDLHSDIKDTPINLD